MRAMSGSGGPSSYRLKVTAERFQSASIMELNDSFREKKDPGRRVPRGHGGIYWTRERFRCQELRHISRIEYDSREKDTFYARLFHVAVNINKHRSAMAVLDVYVMAVGGKEFDGLLLERMAVTRQLWRAGIRAEYLAKVKPKPLQQFKAAMGVSLAVIFGQDEFAAGQVRLKVFQPNADEEQELGRLIFKENLVEEVKRLL